MAKITQCIAVKQDRDGFCRCAKYAPAGTIDKTFEQLCKEKKFDVKVGKTIKKFNDLGGLTMKKRRFVYRPKRRRHFGSYGDYNDFDDLDDVLSTDTDDNLGFVDDIADALGVDMEEVKTLTVIGGSAAGAGIVWSLIETKFVDNLVAGKSWGDYAKVGAKALAGILLSSAVKKYNRSVAIGIGAGLIGSAFVDLTKKFVPSLGAPAPVVEGSVKGFDEDYTLPEPEEMPVAGYLSEGEEDETGIPTEGVVEEEKLYGVEEKDNFYGVEEEKLYGVEEEEQEVIL